MKILTLCIVILNGHKKHIGTYVHNTYVYVIQLSVLDFNLAYLLITVRLVNGPTEYEGRVEVYYNGEWGTVCDNGWGLNDAQVVCRQLDFGRAIAARDNAFYGEGSGQIWLDYVYCTGTELTIEECYHNGWGYEDCFHGQDAGVECLNGKIDLRTYICMYVHLIVCTYIPCSSSC